MECSFNYQYSYSNNTHHLAYNLCPLFSRHQSLKHEIVEDTPPTQTKYIYDMALGKGIKKDGTLPVDLQCPSNSFICLTVINTRPSHLSEPPRILQVVPVSSGEIRPKFRIINMSTGVDIQETHLQLTVHGLQYMKQNQKAVFHMQCDESENYDEESTAKLEFLYNWNGTHVFNWKTTYGCPIVTQLPEDTKQNHEDSDESDDALPPVDPEPDEDIPPPSDTPASPWSFGLAIVIALVVLHAIISRTYRLLCGLRSYVLGRIRRPKEVEFPLEELVARTETQPLTKHNDSSIHYQRYTF